MVGAPGFEPGTSRTPSVRATRLRYAPTDTKAARNCKKRMRRDSFKAITCVRAGSRKRAANRANPEAFFDSKVASRHVPAESAEPPRDQPRHRANAAALRQS